MKSALAILGLLLLAAPVLAQVSSNYPTYRSSKETQLAIHKGDLLFGGRLALGGVYGASVGFVAEAEYVVSDSPIKIEGTHNAFGIGGLFGYSQYSDNWWGDQWKYTNIILLINGIWHVDVFHVEQLDTYTKFGLGYNFGSASWDGAGHWIGSSATHGGIVAGFSIGARYFVAQNFAVIGELGFGMGVLRIGVDLKL